MAEDASDQTFISALRKALPEMRYQPLFEVSMEGVFLSVGLVSQSHLLTSSTDPASSLFGVARELLSFIDYLLLQNIDG